MLMSNSSSYTSSLTNSLIHTITIRKYNLKDFPYELRRISFVQFFNFRLQFSKFKFSKVVEMRWMDEKKHKAKFQVLCCAFNGNLHANFVGWLLNCRRIVGWIGWDRSSRRKPNKERNRIELNPPVCNCIIIMFQLLVLIQCGVSWE